MADFNELYSTYKDLTTVFLEDERFFKEFLHLLNESNNEFSLTKKQCVKNLELDWIEMIENCLPSVDKVMRSPRKFIENREEILPIEVSRNITVESIKHLSQHTNLISDYDGDKVTPSKILNVFREESLDTYENRFVNTLLNRLYIFISKRYDKLQEAMLADDYLCLKYNQDINVNDEETLNISFELKTSAKSEMESYAGSSVFGRVKKIRKIIAEYTASPFAEQMKKYPFIKPPVMRTNAIMKNTELRNCLNLWIFIESYDKIGYTIDFIDTVSKPDDKYIHELYGLTAIHYALFKYYTKTEKDDLVIRKIRKKKAVVPKFIKDIYDEFTTEYNITEVEFRKIMDVQKLNLHKKKCEQEKKIKLAIDNALKADKLYKKKALAVEKLKNKNRGKLVS